jgi:hypothetical protein
LDLVPKPTVAAAEMLALKERVEQHPAVEDYNQGPV